MATDHAWLWDRGYEGGGPQLELLRRLAHWMMREPELEEERLIASGDGLTVTITRRTLGDETAPVTITGPDGTVVEQTLEPVAPGNSIKPGQRQRLACTAFSRGTKPPLSPLVRPRQRNSRRPSQPIVCSRMRSRSGAVDTLRIEDGVPGTLRDVRRGRVAAGRGWIGITPQRCLSHRRCHCDTHAACVAVAVCGCGPCDRRVADRRPQRPASSHTILSPLPAPPINTSPAA